MAENVLVAAAAAASAPAVVLVNRVADAVGGVAAPWQIRRVARAQADGKIIIASADAEVTELQWRAGQRLLEEEARKQANMESILEKALPHVDEESASPGDIEKDWLTNFFEKARLISDSEVQEIWSRILAGEANAPGSFSRKTINTLEDLSKDDVLLFLTICEFVWNLDGQTVPMLAQPPSETNEVDMYTGSGLNFIKLHYLEDLGLLRLNDMTNFILSGRSELVAATYFGKMVQLTLSSEKKGSLEIGYALFTREGEQLWRAFGGGVQPVKGFYEHMHEHWIKEGLVSPQAPPE